MNKDSRFKELLKEKKRYHSKGLLFTTHPKYESILSKFNEEERKEIIELITNEESILNKLETVQDIYIKLSFNNEIAMNMIKDLFIKLKIKHKYKPKDKLILIRRSELDQTPTVFQEKILQFQKLD